MTSENFEKYLLLLKGLLKLRNSQKEEIAIELRDHLEQRIEQLSEDGHSNEQAEKIAIQEFGDAAGLAASFLNATRLNRQRWIMRFTTFAIAGSFIGILFLMSMWPQNGPVRLATSTAQESDDDPFGSEGSSDPFGGDQPSRKKATPKQRTSLKKVSDLIAVSKVRSSAETNAIQALQTEVSSFEVIELPLSDVVGTLSEKYGVPIIISERYLEDSGVDQDTSITLTIQKAKLATVLEFVFADRLGLTDWVYGVKDSVIFVAGEDQIEQLMEVRVYDCKDFAVPASVSVPFNARGMGAPGGMAGASGGMGGGMFCVPSRQTLGQPQAGGLGGSSTDKLGGGEGGTGMGGSKVQPAPGPGVSGPKQGIGPGGFGGGSSPGAGAPGGGGQSGGFGGGGIGGGSAFGYKTYAAQDLSELIECINRTIDSDSWEEMGGPATLTQVGTALVIKQSLKNHDRLEELLVMLRKAKKK